MKMNGLMLCSARPQYPLMRSRPIKPGCRGDSRMNRATEHKLKNPKLSLFDALILGGFHYPRGADATTFDEDGVPLGQRKNQLNRRLRMARKKAAKREREEFSSESSSEDNGCVNQGGKKQKTWADPSSALMIAGSYLRQKVQKQGLKWCSSSRSPSMKNANKQCVKEPAIVRTPLIQEESYDFAPEPVSVSQSEPCYSTYGDYDQQRPVFVNATKSPIDERLSFSSVMDNPGVSGAQLQLEEDDLLPTRIFGPDDTVDASSLTVVSQHSLQQQNCLPLCVNYDSNSNSSECLDSFRLGNQQLPSKDSIPYNEASHSAMEARQTVDLSSRYNVTGVHHEIACSNTSFLSNHLKNMSSSQEDTSFNDLAPFQCLLPSVRTGASTTVQQESLSLFFGGNQGLHSQGFPNSGMPRAVSNAKHHDFATLSNDNNTIWG